MKYLSEKEIKFYFSTDGTVSKWWDPLQGLYGYHFRNIIRAVKSYVAPGKDERVLDVGTGRGLFAIWFAEYGCQVQALDISREMLDLARTNAENRNVADRVRFSIGDAEDLSSFPEETYDWVSCVATFDHIPDLRRAVGEIAKRLKKGGHFLFSYCPPDSLHGWLFKLYIHYISKFYKLGDKENGLVAHLYSHEEIEHILADHSMIIERRLGIGLLCLLLRPEFERGIITAVPRYFSQLEEWCFPFYRSRFFMKRCQIVVGISTKSL